MERDKQVTREGFETREQARADAQRFRGIGGKVTEGGKRADGLWGWSGQIRVDDTNSDVDGKFHCGRCAATGAFITMTVNGRPTGPGGICFRCEGKGYHTRADRARNKAHDQHALMTAARHMMRA